MKRTIRFIFIVVSILLGACSDQVYYKGVVSPDGWAYDDPIIYRFENIDSAENAPFLVIAHDNEYAYENLYLRMEWSYDNSTLIKRDTISFLLVDQMGKWLGTCRGNSCKVKLPFPQGLDVNSSDLQTIMIYQYSRDSLLLGIDAIGLDFSRI